MLRRLATSAITLAAACLALAGCTGYDRFSGTGGSDQLDDNEPPEIERVYEAPRPAPLRAPAHTPEVTSSAWSCQYDPTMNGDWHDDVRCSNGIEQHRPYLRTWDSFITEEEMRASAREYENELNAGLAP